MRERITYNNYGNGHPWYYLLGGPVLSPRTILDEAKASDYRGYNRDEIATADSKCEPQRSEELRRLQAEHLANLNSDISRYRECVRELRAFKSEEHPPYECQEVHVNMGLKLSHIFNEFAHLIWLEELLPKQGDLFG